MRFGLDWLLRLVRQFPPDEVALRQEMTQQDPDFARVRHVHHDALGVLQAKKIADGLSIRREREFWERNRQRG